MTELARHSSTALTVADRETHLATLRKNSKSFYFASRFLPAHARADVAVLYAWCRHVDDQIDQAVPGTEVAALAELRRQLSQTAAGQPDDALHRALYGVMTRHAIPVTYAEALIDGMAMDVEGERYQTTEQLLLYCWRVAGVVGLMMCHILGLREAAARRHAAHLGIAMQLTNICRDVAEDWQLGRLYLPQDMLSEQAQVLLAGANKTAPLPAAAATSLAPTVKALLAQAKAYYASADRGLPALPFRTSVAIAAARLIYSAIGARIRRRQYNVLAGRAVVPTSRKVWLALRAVVGALPRVPQALRPFRPAALPAPICFPKDVLPV